MIKELYDLYNTAFGKKSSKPADLCHCSKTDNLEIASKDARPEQRQVTKRDSTPQKGFRTNSKAASRIAFLSDNHVAET